MRAERFSADPNEQPHRVVNINLTVARSSMATPLADAPLSGRSGNVAGFHYDGNLIVTEETQSAVRRAQLGQTLSISHALKKFTISGELWHFTQPYLHFNAVGNLWAISYPLRRI